MSFSEQESEEELKFKKTWHRCKILLYIIIPDFRIVRLTSPNLNYFILAGGITLYSSVFFRLFPSDSELYTHVRCNVSQSL